MAWMIWRLFFRKKQLKAYATQDNLPVALKRWLRAVVYLFNLHTLILLGLSCLAVYICAVLDLRWNMDNSMVSTGTVFPITFTLSQAFTRRERATSLIANLKASIVALYYMHRDWDQSYGYPSSLGNDTIESARRAKQLLLELTINIRKYLTSPSPWESMAEARLTVSRHEYLSLWEHDIQLSERDRLFRHTVKRLVEEEPGRRYFNECYKCLSRLSVLNEKLTLAAGYTRGGEGGFSRTNQYFRYIISNLEELRSIKEYRTPAMMRHACGVMFHVFAIGLAPYFVHFCDSWEAQGHEEKTCVAGYASAAVYVLVSMLLFHCQADMENCMDETGLDDVFFTIAEELDEVGGEQILRSARSSFSDAAQFLHTASPRPSRPDGFGMGMHILQHRSSQDIPHLKTIPSDHDLSALEQEGQSLLHTQRSSSPPTRQGSPPIGSSPMLAGLRRGSGGGSSNGVAVVQQGASPGASQRAAATLMPHVQSDCVIGVTHSPPL